MDSNNIAAVQAEVARLNAILNQAAGNPSSPVTSNLSAPQTNVSGSQQLPPNAPLSFSQLPPSSQLPPPSSQLSSRITMPYQSARRPTQAPSISQPFLGFNNLGIDMSQQVNQARMSHAQASLPRQASLVTRTSRRRGQAAHPPAIPQIATHPKQCTTEIIPSQGDSIQGVKVTVKVYPPLRTAQDPILVYRFHQDSHNAFLANHFLSYDYNLPFSTTVVALVGRVVSDMEQSPAQYKFKAVTSFQPYLSHENLQLQLLGLVNKGTARRDNHTYLAKQAVTASMTLASLLADKHHFATANGLCVEDGRWVLRFLVRHNPIEGLMSLGDGLPTRHRCLSQRMYTDFRRDSDGDEDSDDGDNPSCVDGCDAEVADYASQSLLPVSSRVATPSLPPTTRATTRSLQRSNSLADFPHLPRHLWASGYNPPRLDAIYSSESMKDTVISRAESRTHLIIRGQCIAECADQLMRTLKGCVEAGTFEKMLAPTRSFMIYDANEESRSSGQGVEREVIWFAYSAYLAKPERWFLPRADGFSSVATSVPMSSSSRISPARLADITMLGALVALLLLNGIAPPNFDPLVLEFIARDCQLDAIHYALLAEWHPELAQLIKMWLAMPCDGSLEPFQAHFATYHDIQVAILEGHSQDTHQALAAEMLYRGLVGPEPPTHPEIAAFRKGFNLPCSGGFNFSEVPLLFEGGSSAFWSLIYTSRITCPDDLLDRTTIVQPDSSVVALCPGLDLTALLTNWIRGQGIPCPGLFEEFVTSFDSIIDLTTLDSPGFRARMLCWAATGSPSLEIGSDGLYIYFTGDEDPNYATRDIQNLMIANGKISYRTCFNVARLPASYIARLHQTAFSADQEPRSFERAFDHWLLVECLAAIGGLTMM